MGYRICTIAAPVAPDILAAALGVAIGAVQPGEPARGWWIARLHPSGWSVLWAEETGFGARVRPQVALLSQTVPVIHCEINETVMWSAAEAWSGGVPEWKVSHLGCDGDLFDLTVSGTPPPALGPIRAEHEARQRDVDDCDHMFEIPLELARCLTGFRHDETTQAAAFHLVLPPPRPSFWARLWGRG